MKPLAATWATARAANTSPLWYELVHGPTLTLQSSWRWKQNTGACSQHFTEGECRGCEQRAASAMQHSLFSSKKWFCCEQRKVWRVEFWVSYCGVRRKEQEILFVSIFSLFLNQTDNSLKEKHTKFWVYWLLKMMRLFGIYGTDSQIFTLLM